MRNHIEPPEVAPKGIVSSLVFTDGCSYSLTPQGRWVWMTFRAPPGLLFRENRLGFIQQFQWRRHFRPVHECEFLAKAFKLLTGGFVEDPKAEQPS